ncbi:Lipase, class 3 family-containing protein [Strongyloides ratti]|uniref:Lipase, class 3 family-containing protein n=1 Tax=Strongyloides ratti TaxID=34506 RepID=A0A090LJR0_STRRB|nr:Lipase, class 3 family-containing protein [Strongyloides ratti]CEF69953.1 Lipase, class 3 family-containing protein [Strongyloides ratti]
MYLKSFPLIFLIKFNIFLTINPQNLYQSQYNEENAKYLHLLCYESYFQNSGKCIPQLVEYFASYHLYQNNFIICDNSRNKCGFYILVSVLHKKIIIVFAGTITNGQLFKQMLSVFQKRIYYLKSGLVNKYYAISFEKLWPHVRKVFEERKYYNYKVYVTGHSLGSVYAAFTAFRIHQSGIRKSSDIFLYTFGQPRIGSYEFALNFDRRVPNSYRVVVGSDFVAHFPPCKKANLAKSRFYKRIFRKRTSKICDSADHNGYYHHGTEIWYPRGTDFEYIICNGYPKNEDFKCSDQLLFYASKIREHRDNHSVYFTRLVRKYIKMFLYTTDQNCKIIEHKNYRRNELSYLT